MTTSGTINFNPPLSEIIEEAFERAGSESRTGYNFATARRSLSLLFLDWANRGINLWTVASNTITLVQGQSNYTLPVDCVDIVEQLIRTNAGQINGQTDLTCTRISIDTYTTIPNKLVQGRPLQVWVDRQGPGTSTAPQINIWPTPDGSQTWTFAYWYLRRIQDPGNSGIVTQDVPPRMLPALTAGLAYYIAMKIPEGTSRVPMLKQEYIEAWELAAGEDREKAPIRLIPRGMPL
jgi:hypothetical protein